MRSTRTCLYAAGLLTIGLSCMIPIFAQTAEPTQNQGAISSGTPTSTDQSVTLTAKEAERAHQALTDWAQLGRYRNDDAKLLPSSPSERRVVFMGDSITDNWGRKYGQFFPGKHYINRGISGQTTPQMLVRFQQDVVELHPAAVLILAGINDIAGNTGTESLTDIENNFRSMVAIAKQNHIRIVIASTLPASTLPWRPKVQPSNQVHDLNDWLQKFAHAEHLAYCNYYPALADANGGLREDLAFDKAVHPNDAGYAVMAPIAKAAIEKALSQPRP